MIQVEEALMIVEENCCKMQAEKIKVSKSLGYILSETIYSPMNMPPFRQSAMDGYAFSHSELTNYEVINTSKAGDYSNHKLNKNQAIRIFTGAFIPDDLDTVVMQEHTSRNGTSIAINKLPTFGANVRNEGEQIKKHELVLQKDTIITPAAVGFLACLGITEIVGYAKPKVAIVVTGNELVPLGKKLPKGKIYESNSLMIAAALKGIGIKKVKLFKVKDNLKATKKVLNKCLSNFDVVLVSGGISVGDYDFVKEALLANGVEELFYKINQKPGKPLFFGKKDTTIVFALPGNPASALSSFYIYVLPALKKRMGCEAIHLPKIKRRINTDFTNTSGKSLFLKAFYNDEHVEVLDSQSSAMLNTFAVANSFIYVPYDMENVKKNQEVVVIPIH
ncbi:gephyrin-like molybdotransferase Glp [Flavobacterium sp.]|uniref:molybdopterin molybdotransferase MoeA n=1 Tax=Flavobacterium sp. TaxID=239 RepID=UPI00286D9597|nr:gephyrin-like molybdotransferase Glp [Flavobacterium sp.]